MAQITPIFVTGAHEKRRILFDSCYKFWKLTWDIDERFDELGQDKAGIENNVIELLEAIFAKQFPEFLNFAENNDKGLEYV